MLVFAKLSSFYDTNRNNNNNNTVWEVWGESHFSYQLSVPTAKPGGLKYGILFFIPLYQIRLNTYCIVWRVRGVGSVGSEAIDINI